MAYFPPHALWSSNAHQHRNQPGLDRPTMANHQLRDQSLSPPNIATLTLTPARDPSIPPRPGVCYWRKMPLELRIMVYRLAFSRPFDMPIKIKFKTDVDANNKIWMSDPGFSPPPFRHFVSDLLVSRGWLEEVTQLLFGTYGVQFAKITPESLYYLDGSPADRMLGFKHLRTVHVYIRDLASLAPLLAVNCPDLKHLHVYGQDGKDVRCEFNAPGLKTRASHQHSLACIESSAWLKEVSHLNGLKSVTVKSDYGLFYANMSSLRKALERSLTRKQEPVTMPLWRALRPASMGPLLHQFEKKKAEAGSSSQAAIAAAAAPTAGPADGVAGHDDSAAEYDTTLVSDDEYVSDFSEDDTDSIWDREDDDGVSSSSDYD